MQTTLYREHHRAIRYLVSRMPQTSVAPAEEQIRPVLVKLTELLKTHLKLGDDDLYPAMFANVDPDVRGRAEDLQAEMGGLAEAFDRFSDRWIAPRAIAADPAGFTRDWSGIRSALTGRIAREDRDLFA
jgi:hypothetical protein